MVNDMPRQIITIEKNGYTCRFRLTKDRGGVEATVEFAGAVILEWEYPRMKRGLQEEAELWVDQAIVEAKSQQKNG